MFNTLESEITVSYSIQAQLNRRQTRELLTRKRLGKCFQETELKRRAQHCWPLDHSFIQLQSNKFSSSLAFQSGFLPCCFLFFMEWEERFQSLLLQFFTRSVCASEELQSSVLVYYQHSMGERDWGERNEHSSSRNERPYQ